ncbi:hypothetical protein AAF712_005535 [Marasmius tenuissimus]|uniref:Capsid protein n=1 Tax=Marasmius tenuissimus TaxID=585030 RepID=A0ABR3A1R1_9AGAR
MKIPNEIGSLRKLQQLGLGGKLNLRVTNRIYKAHGSTYYNINLTSSAAMSQYQFPVVTEEVLPLSLPWERDFEDGTSFTDWIRDFPLTYFELCRYGSVVQTRDYDDTVDFFEIPGQDYMPNCYLHTTHLTETPNHITHGPMNPFSFFGYFDNIYVELNKLYSTSTDLPICERRPFVKFQQAHDEMVTDGAYQGVTDIVDYIRTVGSILWL